jgi:tight adherence protein B
VNQALAAGAAASLSMWFAALGVRARGRDRVVARAGSLSPPARHVRPRERTSASRLLTDRRARAVISFAGAGLGLVAGGPPLALCGAAAGLAIPAAITRARESKRSERIGAQLGAATASIAAALRSGLSLQQAIRFASEEGAPPVSRSLARVVERESLGVPLEECLEQWASHEKSADVRLVASVMQLHHRVGGESPAVLDQAARTVGLRRAAARELRSLTAQARLSGAVLGLLPVGFFAFMSVVSRQDVRAAYTSAAGLASILVGLGLDAGAFLWIRKLLRVET